MNLSWKIGVIIALVAIISMAAIGVTYAANFETNSLCAFSWTYSNDDGAVDKPAGFDGGIDPGDNGADPQTSQTSGVECGRNSANIASTAVSFTADTITFNLNNAYPGYFPTVFFGLSNQWATPGFVQSIDIQNSNPGLLTVNLGGIALNQIIEAGETIPGALSIRVGDIPQTQINNYSLSLTLVVSQWAQSGQTLSINNLNLPGGQVNLTYAQTLTGSNGNSPYIWNISSGALPPGLTLDALSGVISGVPSAAGAFNFTIKVTDKAGDTAIVNLSIAVPYPSVPTPNGSNPAAGSSSSGTPAIEPPPGGNTAEIPPVVSPTVTAPAGNTAEIPPVSTPAEIPQSPAIVTAPVSSAVINQSGPGATALPGSNSAITTGTSHWPLIIKIFAITVLLMIWLIILILRRRKKNLEADTRRAG